MLQHTTDFPQAGSIGYLRHTATKARIIRHNADDGTMLVQVFDPRDLHGKASGNRTVEPSEIFADPETASFGSIRAAKRAQRARAAGGTPFFSDDAGRRPGPQGRKAERPSAGAPQRSGGNSTEERSADALRTTK